MSHRGHGSRGNPHNNRQRSYDRFANENRADRERSDNQRRYNRDDRQYDHRQSSQQIWSPDRLNQHGERQNQHPEFHNRHSDHQNQRADHRTNQRRDRQNQHEHRHNKNLEHGDQQSDRQNQRSDRQNQRQDYHHNTSAGPKGDESRPSNKERGYRHKSGEKERLRRPSSGADSNRSHSSQHSNRRENKDRHSLGRNSQAWESKDDVKIVYSPRNETGPIQNSLQPGVPGPSSGPISSCLPAKLVPGIPSANVTNVPVIPAKLNIVPGFSADYNAVPGASNKRKVLIASLPDSLKRKKTEEQPKETNERLNEDQDKLKQEEINRMFHQMTHQANPVNLQGNLLLEQSQQSQNDLQQGQQGLQGLRQGKQVFQQGQQGLHQGQQGLQHGQQGFKQGQQGFQQGQHGFQSVLQQCQKVHQQEHTSQSPHQQRVLRKQDIIEPGLKPESGNPLPQPSSVGQGEPGRGDVHGKPSTSKCGCGQDNVILMLIKEQIEKVRSAQEKEKINLIQEREKIEKEKSQASEEKRSLEKEAKRIEDEKSEIADESTRLQQEKQKLQKAKTDLKETVDNGLELLKNEKSKMEESIRKAEKKNIASEMAQLRQKLFELECASSQEKRELEKQENKEVIEMQEQIKDMTSKAEEKEKELVDLRQSNMDLNTELEKVQNKKQDTETLELELDMTKETLARLEQEMDTLKREMDTDYKVFIKKKNDFDNTASKIRCVFCPGDTLHSLASFIFHVAREHMFEQYKNVQLDSETTQVGMLLKKLEEKARNDFNQESNLLRKNLLDAHMKTEKLENMVAEKEGTINGLSEEIIHISKEWEAAKMLNDKQKESVDALVTRNNTLENQLAHFRDANQEKKLKMDNKILTQQLKQAIEYGQIRTQKIAALSKERDLLKQKLTEVSNISSNNETKLTEARREKDICMRRLEDKEKAYQEMRNKLKFDARQAQEERNSLKLKLDACRTKLSASNADKTNLEAEISSLRKENQTIKEFRSDMSSVNQVLLKESREENKNLSSKLRKCEEELCSIQSKYRSATSRSKSLENELKCLTDETRSQESEHQQLKDKIEELTNQHYRLQAELELERKKKSHGTDESATTAPGIEDDFSNFDLGLESLLRAPLDMINLQIDEININQDRHEKYTSTELQNSSSEKLQELSISSDHDHDHHDHDHEAWCNCVECDDIDYLHGFINGKPFGIKEMMERLNQPLANNETLDDHENKQVYEKEIEDIEHSVDNQCHTTNHDSHNEKESDGENTSEDSYDLEETETYDLGVTETNEDVNNVLETDLDVKENIIDDNAETVTVDNDHTASDRLKSVQEIESLDDLLDDNLEDLEDADSEDEMELVTDDLQIVKVSSVHATVFKNADIDASVGIKSKSGNV